MSSVANGSSINFLASSFNNACCEICKKPALFTCNNCRIALYCSGNCQRMHFKAHQTECVPMPLLLPIDAKKNSFSADVSMTTLALTNLYESASAEERRAFEETAMKIKQNEIKGLKTKSDTQRHSRSKGTTENHNGNDKKRNLKVEEKQIPNRSRVEITDFYSSNRCCIRWMNENGVRNLERINMQVNSAASRAKPLRQKPDTHTYALAKTENFSTYGRAEVIASRSKDDMVRILLIDLGKLCKRNYRDLLEMDEELYVLPSEANFVQLHSVPNVWRNENIEAYYKSVMSKEYEIECGVDGLGDEITLKDWSTKESLNEKLNEIYKQEGLEPFNATKNRNYQERKAPEGVNKHSERVSNRRGGNVERVAEKAPEKVVEKVSEKAAEQAMKKVSEKAAEQAMKKVAEKAAEQAMKKVAEKAAEQAMKKVAEKEMKRAVESSPVMKAPFERCLFKKGDTNLSVIVLDTSSIEANIFSAIAQPHIKYLAKIQALLNPMQDDKPYKPKLEEFCVAKFEEEWYRAQVIAVLENDNYKLIYIDYYNEGESSSRDIRRFPADLKEPCYTNICGFQGVPDNLNAKQAAFLCKSVLAQQPLTIDIVEIDEELGAAYVDCPSIVQKIQALK